MKLILLPKAHQARQSAYLILISFLILMLFYVIDEFLMKGIAEGLMLIILNILVFLSLICAIFGTVLGIISIYKSKELSFLLIALLFLGFTFSVFGLLELFIPTQT
ncbi:MAG: hypothetical protein WC992_01050 [Acholeplasmataceae bacterium]|jgi:hypothetical protein|nr:hypothetical protein [Acholeplasmataceae bacterium]